MTRSGRGQKGGRDHRSAQAEEKRQRRFARQAAEAESMRRAARRSRVRGVAAFAVVAVVAIAALAWLAWPEPEIAGVERIASKGRDHSPPGTPLRYDDPTPTSGAHWTSAPRCGVHATSLELPLAVHALEHGTIVVWHSPALDPDRMSELQEELELWDSHVIVSPNAQIDDEIVLTAWTRRLALAEFDRDAIHEFIDVYRQRGPERVDCPV